MLGGKQPFRTDSLAGTLGSVLHTEVPPITEVNRNVPAPLSAVVERLLEKDPAARYPSASALRADLLATREGHKLQFAEVARPRRRSRWVAVAVLGVLLVIASFAGHRALTHRAHSPCHGFC